MYAAGGRSFCFFDTSSVGKLHPPPYIEKNDMSLKVDLKWKFLFFYLKVQEKL